MNWKPDCKGTAMRSAFCAAAAPVVHTAAGCPWWISLLTALFMGMIHHCASAREVPSYVAGLRELFNTLAAVTILDWMTQYWNGLPDYAIVISAVVFALWVGSKDIQSAHRAWGIAFYFVVGLLASVLLSGLMDVHSDNLLPVMEQGKGWEAALGILLAFRFGCGAWTYAAAPIASFISLGVLGTAGTVPFYELSRCIRFLGVAPRFESLCACAVTMSFLIGLTVLLSEERNSAKMERVTMIKAAWSVSLWYLGVRIPSEVLCLGILLLWVIPSLMNNRVIISRCERRRKNTDE